MVCQNGTLFKMHILSLNSREVLSISDKQAQNDPKSDTKKRAEFAAKTESLFDIS